MERRPGWCGIDVGTSGVRSVVLDDHGTVLGHGSRRLPSSRREGDRHEQDPQAWWTALCGAVRDAVDEAGPEVVVRAVALDATSGTVLVESSDGSSVGPALMYDDARGAALADEAQTAGEALWTSLGYRIQPTWALPRALWLQRSGDLAPSDRIVHQADHLVGRLLGRPAATDTSHALKTGADPRRGPVARRRARRARSPGVAAARASSSRAPSSAWWATTRPGPPGSRPGRSSEPG